MATASPVKAEEDNVAQWREDFKQMANKEGHITRKDLEEYWQIHRNLNPTRDNVTEVIKAAECKDIEKISEKEFLKVQEKAVSEHFYTADPKCDLEEALSVYDKDEDGTISRTDLKEILTHHGDTFDDIINMADPNGNGKLTIKGLMDILIPDQKVPET